MEIGLTDALSEGFELYRNFQENHRILGSMITAEATFLTGDAISQLITDRKIDGRKLRYTAALAPLYGLCLEGLIQTGELVGKFISDNPLAKAALGPNLWGNFMTTFFFVNNTVGEREEYSIPELVKHYGRIVNISNSGEKQKGFFRRFREDYIGNIPKKEFWYSVAGILTAWNVFQYANYEYIEESMRTPATLAATFVWVPLLSFWSLKGRRRIVDRASKT